MTLPNGLYRTAAGSKVKVYGEHSGCAQVAFDWLEEPNACIECVPEPHPEEWVDGSHWLNWKCDECGGGSAVLKPVKKL